MKPDFNIVLAECISLGYWAFSLYRKPICYQI